MIKAEIAPNPEEKKPLDFSEVNLVIMKSSKNIYLTTGRHAEGRFEGVPINIVNHPEVWANRTTASLLKLKAELYNKSINIQNK